MLEKIEKCCEVKKYVEEKFQVESTIPVATHGHLPSIEIKNDWKMYVRPPVLRQIGLVCTSKWAS